MADILASYVKVLTTYDCSQSKLVVYHSSSLENGAKRPLNTKKVWKTMDLNSSHSKVL